MHFDAVECYLRGDAGYELAIIRALRRLGETCARRLGLQSFDADVIGVDFAAYMLTQGSEGLRDYEGDRRVYLRRAARRFTSNRTRQLRDKRGVSTTRGDL